MQGLKIFKKKIVRRILNEVSLGIHFHLKKKVRGGCALPAGDVQKPYAPKCGQGKTKIGRFRDFLQKPPMSYSS
jgi:hypothetical protein